MDDQKSKDEVESMNDVLFDTDLSIDELEERLEFSSVWICGVYDNRCQPIHTI